MRVCDCFFISFREELRKLRLSQDDGFLLNIIAKCHPIILKYSVAILPCLRLGSTVKEFDVSKQCNICFASKRCKFFSALAAA